MNRSSRSCGAFHQRLSVVEPAIEIFQTHTLPQILLLHFPPPTLPCQIFRSCIFHPLHYSADISTAVFSTPATPCRYFHSCIFQPCNFDRANFSTPTFSAPPSESVADHSRRKVQRWQNYLVHMWIFSPNTIGLHVMQSRGNDDQ